MTRARSPWLDLGWVAAVTLMVSCGEQHEPRASPIVTRRLGGDSIAPGALLKVCAPGDEGCVPTFPVACSETWMGDSADKPHTPALSPEAQAWCDAQGAAGSVNRR
jgi:hypothetical protein